MKWMWMHMTCCSPKETSLILFLDRPMQFKANEQLQKFLKYLRLEVPLRSSPRHIYSHNLILPSPRFSLFLSLFLKVFLRFPIWEVLTLSTRSSLYTEMLSPTRTTCPHKSETLCFVLVSFQKRCSCWGMRWILVLFLNGCQYMYIIRLTTKHTLKGN